MPTIKDMISEIKIKQERSSGTIGKETQPMTICNKVLESLRLAV
jgi:hypothetical protein